MKHLSSMFSQRTTRVIIIAMVMLIAVGVLTSGSVFAATNGTMVSATNTLPYGAIFLNDGQGGHWWVSDGVLGICRLDAQTVVGQPPFKPNACNGTAKAGGQIVVGPSPTGGTYLYVADMASKSIHVVRFTYTFAAGQPGNISNPLAINVNNPTFVGGGNGGGRAVALALSARPGGGQDLYVGYLKSGDIMRVPNVQSIGTSQNPPVEKVGNTSDGKGVNAFVMLNNNLYIAELGGLGLSKIPDPSGLNRPACSAAAPCAAVSVSPQVSFFPGGLATDGTYIYIGNVPLTAPNSILRYNPANGSAVTYSDAVPAYVSAFDGVTRTQYVGPFGLGYNPTNGDLYVGDDPTFLLATPPLQQGHFWKVPAAPVAPTVTSISPTSGTSAGGTVVTITGTGFVVGGTTVNFGANAGTAVTCTSITSCVATSPAGLGTVGVIVTANGQPSVAVAADQFTYVTPPPPGTLAVSAISPTTGATTGGTLVTITGQGFITGTTGVANFGANLASNVNCTSTTNCTATSPVGAAGIVDVQIAFGGPPSAATAADKFTYVTPVATLYAWGVTAPKGGAVWLPGSLGGHWWSSDHSQGLCRQDSVPGTTLNAINFAVCASDLVGSAGQAVYDPRANLNGTHYVYVPDNAVKSTAVWRLTFDPVTEKMVVDPFDGVTLATAMAPLADLRTLKPNGMALGPGPNFDLYVTDLVEKNVRKVTNPGGDPRTQVVSIVAETGDGKGANGTQGFIGNLLYISGNRATQFFDITKCPTTLPNGSPAPCGMASVPAPTGIFVAGTAVDAINKKVYMSDSPGGANAVIHRYNATNDVYVAFVAGSVAPDLNGVVTCPGCTVGSQALLYVTGGIFPTGANATVYCALTCTRPWDFGNHPGGPGSIAKFSFVFGLGIKPDGTLAITEDPSAGARAGRGTMWTVPFIP